MTGCDKDIHESVFLLCAWHACRLLQAVVCEVAALHWIQLFDLEIETL